MQSALLVSPVTPDQVPPGHGVGAEPPSPAQYEAIAQARHAVAPLLFWNRPGLQGAQLSDRLAGAAEPGLHGFGAVAPVEQAAPAGHSWHSPLLVRLRALLHRPAGHGSAADAPVPQKEPATHSTQAMRPL